MVAQCEGSIDATIKGQSKTFNTLSVFRRAVKGDVYRKARLCPRPSDVDFDVEGDAKCANYLEPHGRT